MNHFGNIQKMDVKLIDGIVNYVLPIGKNKVPMNELIGKEITLNFANKIHCTHCGNQTEKSYKGGYCKTCSETLAKCDECRVKPEACSFVEGNCREESWGLENCFNPHLVYLSFTGTCKVGITRHSTDDVSSRWLDQGATSALPILMVKDRLLSGLVELEIKKHVSDRTNWRKMLALVEQNQDMQSTADMIKPLVMEKLTELQSKYGIMAIQWLDNAKVQHIEYPVEKEGYPEKVKSINLDKTPDYKGRLTGIKGQYLIFDDNLVINMRKYAGYYLTISA
jgi:hypothetical protein